MAQIEIELYLNYSDTKKFVCEELQEFLLNNLSLIVNEYLLLPFLEDFFSIFTVFPIIRTMKILEINRRGVPVVKDSPFLQEEHIYCICYGIRNFLSGGTRGKKKN